MRFLLLFLVFISGLMLQAQEIVHNHSIHHSFIENKGQWDEQILFQSKFDGGNLWVEQKKMVFHLQDFSGTQQAHVGFGKSEDRKVNRQTVVHLNFLGANEVSNIEKQGATPNYYNYFIGNDKSKWASEVRGYSEAIMYDLYDGIDLKLIEELEQLKYEFHVQPEKDPAIIQLEYIGQKGITIDKKGSLVVSTALGEIIEQKPYAYQIVNGKIIEVECAFKLEKNRVSFELGEYNPFVTLVIDPVLIFATYSGSVTDNFGMTATYGHDGTAYSGGMIYGNAYPTPDSLAFDINSSFTVVDNPTYGITDVFVSKYSSDGTDMIWTTFLGGGDGNQGTETAHSMICDSSNNIYLFGATSSIDFPIQGGFQTNHLGGEDSLNLFQNGVHFKDQGTDIYVAKISANGQNLMASTFIGGTGNDGVNYKENMFYDYYIYLGDTLVSGIYSNYSDYDSLTTNYGDQFRGEIMLDKDGNCLVASCTKSTDFPVLNAFQPVSGGAQDGVIFKMTSDLSALVWSSYFGGANNDACYSLKVDSSANIVCAGGTCSSDLPFTAGGYQPAYGGGTTDGFIFKLDPLGSMTQSTYFGMSDYDQTYFVETDRIDNIYVISQTNGGNFGPINAGFSNLNSGQVVAKMDPTLTTVLNQVVFGDGNPTFDISPSAFLVDICGNIYVSGWGAHLLQSSDMLGNMPITSDAIYTTAPNGFDFYLIVIERDFSDVLYATYFGEPGSIREHVDGGTSRFDKNGVVYQSVCGACGAAAVGGAVTTPGAWSPTDLSSNCNNLVFKFDFELIPNAEITADDIIGCAPFTVTFDNLSTAYDSFLWDFGNGDTTSIEPAPVVTFETPGVYEVYLYIVDSICLLTDTAQITIFVYDSLSVSTIVDQELCNPTPIDFIAYTNGIGEEFIWSEDINFSDTLNTDLADSVFTHTPTGPGMYYVQVSSQGCSLVDSVYIDFIGSNLTLSANDSICVGESTLITASNSNPSLTFTYEWEPDSIIVNPSVSNTVEVDPMVSQYVHVTATSSNGCVISDSIQIHVGDIPDSLINAISSDYEVPEGDEVTLTASPDGYAYQWLPIIGLSNPNSQITQAIVDESTTYIVFITDGICTKSASVFVKTYAFVCGEPYVYVPNAFSPNGDGENDVLYVEGPFEEMVFRIYDRWGELVFESYDRIVGWDGTFKGRPCDPDVYDYYLDVKCINDQETIVKGNITLLK